ncbi:BRCA1-A complex subunit RAP80 isoform X2 [Triplophysa dalaica]|uniref:BRCA1-A complex subunit RAP80 isoform X2 n=2 Tax=Triplophysa dalaica TaxID=1582913 RepID=UPI0024DFCB90|nr:BRCA1-A complex subunit RAP80 isoform X2 [Triplophysa dalaica]
MPRRKRASGDGGRKPKVSRVEHTEETLVISDSDNEEEEESSASRSSRSVRWRRRECKSQVQEMTEEEMLDLAMKLSAQEASSAAQKRRQLEDNDIQKAIAESLHVSDKEGSVEASGSSAQPQQSMSNIISRLRRKLSYPKQTEVHSGRGSPVAQADGTERGRTSPLPEMPDLSQITPSPSSCCSAQVCGPPVPSQDTTPDIQPNIRDSKEDEFSQPVSLALPSPEFLKDGSFIRQPLVCVEKLSQDLIDTCTGLREQPCTQESIVCVEASQEDSSLPKSHVFTQNDLRERTDLLEDKHDALEENESDTQIPEEDLPPCQGDKCLSPKNTDPEESSSLSSRSQPSETRCEAESANEDVTVKSKTPELKQVEDQIAQDENPAADAESAQNTRSWDGFSSFMVVLLTDDEEEEDGSEEVLPPSPELHGKTSLKRIPQTQPCGSSSTLEPSKQDTQISQHSLQEDSETSNDLKSKSSNSKPLLTGVETEDHCTVSYYWGVPFCPTGQNPDDYTRVIMCQLEVYEKSLKEARRDLLRKAVWSQPVLPASERPFGPRRLKRYRPPQLSEDEDQNEEESGKENKRSEVQKERDEDKAGSQGAAVGGQSETYVVLSSPEAKDEDVQKSPFPNQDKTTAATTHLRKDQRDASDNTQIELADEEEETQNHDQFDDDETVCPETQLTDNNTPELMMTSPEQDQTRADSEVMEVDEGECAPAAEEEVMEQESVSADTAPSQTLKMECPMCSKLFCLSRIEMHAAFCDGETEDQNEEEQSQVVRRTRSRRDSNEETQYRPEKSPEMEKCFVCQGRFTSQQYQAHVELCLKKTESNTHQGDGLLSALQRTEQRPAGSDEAGPSDVSSRSSRGPADLFGEGGPDSEDTDHLTDFQQQYSSKNSQRLARKRKFKR